MKDIVFFNENGPNGEFSTYSRHPIYIEDEMWKTVEHFFQASKFEDIEIKRKIKAIDSPMQITVESRSMNDFVRSDWDFIEENVIKQALICKFLQHPILRKKLLLTGDATIIGHISNDIYWGDGGNGTDKNRLGILLMEVRYELNVLSGDPLLVLPPWIAFPTLNKYGMFWRMGFGEDYIIQWSNFYHETNKEAYRNKFPEPSSWKGIYCPVS